MGILECVLLSIIRSMVVYVGGNVSVLDEYDLAWASILVFKEGKLKMSEVVDSGHLNSFVERIENLEGEKREISESIKEVYAELSSNGFEAKIVRKIIALRRKDEDERAEEETLLDLYMSALEKA
jgi:uncharacterized protein (UPF0335 family)